MAIRSAFVVGREVGTFGRWFRLITGVYFTLLLTVVPFIADPVPPAETASFLGAVGLYFLLILGIYVAAFYVLGERVLASVNPWIGTFIFLGPLAVVNAFELGPPALRVALGLYYSVASIFNFAMSYGGCEVVAIPSLIFRRRYTLYCPYNAVDAVENALMAGAPGHRLFGLVAIAVAMLVGSYYILLDFMGLSEVLGLEPDRRPAVLFLIPIAFLVRNAWLAYGRAGGRATAAVRNLTIGALVMGLLAAILFFRLDWEPFWGLLLIAGGGYALVRLARAGLGQEQAGPGGLPSPDH